MICEHVLQSWAIEEVEGSIHVLTASELPDVGAVKKDGAGGGEASGDGGAETSGGSCS